MQPFSTGPVFIVNQKILNMKKILLIIAPLVIFFCLSSFAQKGDVYKEERKVESFQSIDAGGVCNIFLKQGNQEELVLEAHKNILDLIITEVRGGTLYIDWKKGSKIKKFSKLNIYITFQELNELDVDIVGNLRTEGTINSTNMEIDFSGVGNVDLAFDSQNIEAEFSMVGNIELSGAADNVDIESNCTGNLDASTLIAKHLVLENASIGNVRVHADETISLVSSGVGNVHYSGDAKVERLDSSGIGKIKSVN